MEKVIGKIEEVSQTSGSNAQGKPWKRASFSVSGKKYNTFDENIMKEFNSGDNVEIEFEVSTSGEYSYNNIKSIKKSDFQQANEVSEPSSNSNANTQTMIVRQSCLKVAVESFKVLNEIDPEKAKSILKEHQLIDSILVAAETFEHWVGR